MPSEVAKTDPDQNTDTDERIRDEYGKDGWGKDHDGSDEEDRAPTGCYYGSTTAMCFECVSIHAVAILHTPSSIGVTPKVLDGFMPASDVMS